ncbi:MAG: DUF5317 family protein [Patescibacteria group bacterium]|nr:DUF5317 family protein [Patescibacteria group bacterium]
MMILLVTLSAIIKQKKVFAVITIVFVGIFCNNLVVESNDGKMPVFIKNMSAETEADLRTAPRHQMGTENTKYAYLADFVSVKVNKAQDIVSPGDISMTLGPILLALSILWQIMCTLRYEGLAGFTRNNLPISYSMSIMTIYAVYLGCRHVILYA